MWDLGGEAVGKEEDLFARGRVERGVLLGEDFENGFEGTGGAEGGVFWWEDDEGGFGDDAGASGDGRCGEETEATGGDVGYGEEGSSVERGECWVGKGGRCLWSSSIVGSSYGGLRVRGLASGLARSGSERGKYGGEGEVWWGW